MPSLTSKTPLHLLVLGIAEGKRMRHMQLAGKKFEPYIQLNILDYTNIIQTPERILDSLPPNSWLKIDSPGEDPQVQEFFIRQGWQLQQHTHRPLQLPTQHGQLMASDDWYYGYADFLNRLESLITPELNIRWVNNIKSILLMTDKWCCQQHFQQYHIPTPQLLGQIHNYDEFQTLMQQHSAAQVFIKARYGSSASGIIAYRRNRQGRQQASSTTIFENDLPFNSKRVRQYTQESDIARLINAIAQYDAYVENWIPKPRLNVQGKSLSFDFRTLMLNGQPQHEIIRASTHPMTNLHLDSHRIQSEQVKTQYGIAHMHDILEQAASTLPDAHIIGFDTIATPSKAWVLEANAFGDLLLDIRHQEQSTYEAQLACLLQQQKIGDYYSHFNN